MNGFSSTPNNLVLALVAMLVNLVLSVVAITVYEHKTVSRDLLMSALDTNKRVLFVSCLVTGALVLMALNSTPVGTPVSMYNLRTSPLWR